MKMQHQQQMILWIAIALTAYLLIAHNNKHVSRVLVDMNSSGSDDDVVDLNATASDDEDDPVAPPPAPLAPPPALVVPLSDKEIMQRSIDYTVGGSRNCAMVLPEHGNVCSTTSDDGEVVDVVSLEDIDYNGQNYIMKDTYSCLSAASYDKLVWYEYLNSPINSNDGMQVKNPINKQPLVCVGQGDELFNNLLYLSHFNLIPDNVHINDQRDIQVFYYHLNPSIRDNLPAIVHLRVEQILQAWARNGNIDQISHGINAVGPVDRLTRLTHGQLRGVRHVMSHLLAYWDHQTMRNWNMRILDLN